MTVEPYCLFLIRSLFLCNTYAKAATVAIFQIFSLHREVRMIPSLPPLPLALPHSLSLSISLSLSLSLRLASARFDASLSLYRDAANRTPARPPSVQSHTKQPSERTPLVFIIKISTEAKLRSF
jgi:hypothetical protein